MIFNHDDPFKLIAVVAPITTSLGIWMFCRMDSERITGYFYLAVVYAVIIVAAPRESGFDLFAVQSSSSLILGGILLSKTLNPFEFFVNKIFF
jgi:hypothetical protein